MYRWLSPLSLCLLLSAVVATTSLDAQCGDSSIVATSDCGTNELTVTLTGPEDYDESVIDIFSPTLGTVLTQLSGPLPAGSPFTVMVTTPPGLYVISHQAACPNGSLSTPFSETYFHCGAGSDCNGNAILDDQEFSNLVLGTDFNGVVTNWSGTGLWHISSDPICFPTPPICDVLPVAYFGQDGFCDFAAGGISEEGDLTSDPILLPAGALSARLSYCSLYEGEGGSPPGGFDSAWVEVNGTIVDEVSNTALPGSWEDRTVDLTAFLGQSITIAFRFDSIDDINNLGLGWAIDQVLIETSPDCNQNGVLDECDTTDGTSADCNGNGVPDECEIADGSAIDCNGNGILDICETSGVVFSVSFDSATLPNGWGTTGLPEDLWNVTGDCGAGIGCGSGAAAYFGTPGACNFDTGVPVEGTLSTHTIHVPAGSLGARLSYCSAYVGEGGNPVTTGGYDWAWVEIGGTIVDNVSADTSTPGGETRTVDLSAYAGSTITISFRFDSVDTINNSTLGWRIDDIELSYGRDCNRNGILDECDILAGEADCDGDGLLDVCSDALGGGFSAPNLPVVSNAGPVVDTITVSDPGVISDVDVAVEIPHSWIGDLQVSVASPAGTSVFLHDLTEGNTDDLIRLYDDEGAPGTFLPAQPLSAFDGEGAPGDWTLTVVDDVNLDDGTLVSWQLILRTYSDCNGNGVDDDCDIASGSFSDCDANGVPDVCDVAAGASDCDADGVPDRCQQTILFAESFDSGALPMGWTGEDLWTVTDSCGSGVQNLCDGGPFAYFGDTTICTADFGVDYSSTLTAPSFDIPADSATAVLSYCSRYQGEGGVYDLARVLANGIEIDFPSEFVGFGQDTGWVPRLADLSAFAGQTVTLTFVYDTVDSCCDNGFLGWQVDGIEVIAAPDCNGNGVADLCDIASGLEEDCNGNGFPDSCDIAGGTSADDNLNGVPDECEAQFFDRADCNADGSLNIADAVFTLATLFSMGPTGPCADACDANDDGNINIADAVFTLANLFSMGPDPSAPFGACGDDPTADALDCANFPPCP